VQCVAVCCSVLQCVAVCCSVLLSGVAITHPLAGCLCFSWCSASHTVATVNNVLQCYLLEKYSVLQCYLIE